MSDIEKTPAQVIEPPVVQGQVRESKDIFGFIHSEPHNDINLLGKELLQKALEFDEAQLERDAVKVRRKLDYIVIPMVWTSNNVIPMPKLTCPDDDHIHAQFPGQANVSTMPQSTQLSTLTLGRLNYSNAYGLQADTHMKGDDYSWVASALYFGWLLAAYPWNIALQRFPIGRLIGYMLFVWGVICMLQAAVFNFGGFVAIRFVLGMVEACISPAFVLLTSMLWTREEQALRTSFWLSTNGVSSILGALLAYGSGHAENLAVSNWKLIYLVSRGTVFTMRNLTDISRLSAP